MLDISVPVNITFRNESLGTAEEKELFQCYLESKGKISQTWHLTEPLPLKRDIGISFTEHSLWDQINATSGNGYN